MDIKKLFNENKKKALLFTAVFVLFIVLYIVLCNTYFFYKDSVLKVTEVRIISQDVANGANGRKEKQYTQEIHGEILNGTYMGQSLEFTNKYKESETSSIKIKKGEKLIAALSDELKKDSRSKAILEDGSSVNFKLISEKRDNYLFLLVSIFIIAMILVARKNSIYTIISLVINISVFYCMLKKFGASFFDKKWLFVLLVFLVVTIFCAVGFNKKTLGSIISAIVSVAVIFLVYYLSVIVSKDMDYEFLEYMDSSKNLDKIFLASTIIGSLGAIMDVSVTINSSVFEIFQVTPDIKKSSMIKSVKKIGYDIMGTMINVLFFSYISSSLTLVVLKVHSGYSIKAIVEFGYVYDIVRFLTGSIGIILTIPISAVIGILLYNKNRDFYKKEEVEEHA